jgi:hypothetical protein
MLVFTRDRLQTRVSNAVLAWVVINLGDSLCVYAVLIN